MDAPLLAELAKDENHYVRSSAAINLLISPVDLIRLSLDERILIREGVSENINYCTKAKAKVR